MAGHDSFVAVAVASPGSVAPCGACRQFLLEFVTDAHLELIDAVHPSQESRSLRLDQLLPERFSRASLQSGKGSS
jgi:cytidine deaminase